jgi:hypothetical protein
MEIILKKIILQIVLISCLIKGCMRNLPDNIFIQFLSAKKLSFISYLGKKDALNLYVS